MFRRLRKLVRSHREKLLSLVILPAFFLATLPHGACICGDGHREAFCNLSICHAIYQGKATGVCCGCSCCKNKCDEQRSCCHSKHRPAEPVKSPVSGIGANTGTCCHPIIETPAPALELARLVLNSHWNVPIASPTIALADATESHGTRFVFDYHGPPPRDAVIVFQRLTI